MSNFSIDTGAVRIFCSNKDADTTTSSPNKIVSSNLIFCAKSSDDLIKIDVVSYPIPLISILNGYSAFISSKGTIVSFLDKGDVGILEGYVNLRESRSFYNEYGYIFSYVIIFISLLMLIIVCFRSKKI